MFHILYSCANALDNHCISMTGNDLYKMKRNDLVSNERFSLRDLSSPGGAKFSLIFLFLHWAISARKSPGVLCRARGTIFASGPFFFEKPLSSPCAQLRFLPSVVAIKILSSFLASSNLAFAPFRNFLSWLALSSVKCWFIDSPGPTTTSIVFFCVAKEKSANQLLTSWLVCYSLIFRRKMFRLLDL